MLQRFQPSGRFETSALSYVNIESRDKSLCVQAFHTFPDDSAVLKIQSWYIGSGLTPERHSERSRRIWRLDRASRFFAPLRTDGRTLTASSTSSRTRRSLR